MPSVSARNDALRQLAARELSVAEIRARLLARDHPEQQVEAAIAALLESGALDDARVARAYARTAVNVKGRGRLRVVRELDAKGISREVVAAAVADVFGELDERTLVSRAIQKTLRGRRPATPAELARLYRHLLRQGFSPAVVTAAMRALRDHPDM